MIGWLKKGLTQVKTSLTSTPKQPFSFGSSNFGYRLRSTPLLYYIIGINVGVYGLQELKVISPKAFLQHFTLSNYNISQGRYHTAITHSFAHQSFFHLASNLIGIYFFGSTIENVFGRRALGKLYLGSALIGAGMILLEERTPQLRYSNRYHLGASSAVCSMVTYFALNFPKHTIYLYFIPVPAWLAGIGLILYSTYQFGQRGGSISHSGHLGGAIFGAAAFALTRKGLF